MKTKGEVVGVGDASETSEDCTFFPTVEHYFIISFITLDDSFFHLYMGLQTFLGRHELLHYLHCTFNWMLKNKIMK